MIGDRIIIIPLGGAHRNWANRLLTREWGGPVMVTRGRAHDLSRAAGFVALAAEEPVGLATYRLEGNDCELMSMNSLRSGQGIGTALLSAVQKAADEAGCRRLWLITTNDNTPALRFYQRRGFRLVALHKDALEASRKLKPEIPYIGRFGIPLRDEIELDLLLDDSFR